MPILDRIAAQSRRDFRPSTVSEFFALRLAIRLGLPETARHLSLLASEHGVEKLASTFQRATALTSGSDDLARRFHRELTNNLRNGLHVPSSAFAGIRVERRCIGAAIFRHTRLETARVRILPADPLKAEAATSAFVAELIRDHNFESAALEVFSPSQEIQRSVLTKAILNQLRQNSISVWELNKKIVAAAFGYPPLTTRVQLREIIQTIWPQLNPRRHQVCVLDAVAMGLFIQTERLFNNF